MKVIIAGSRTIKDQEAVDRAIWKSGFPISEVVSGCALGVDTAGELWAQRNGRPIKRMRPEYHNYQKMLAPKIRNRAMAEYADALIGVWDGMSGGTAHMIACMVILRKPTYVEEVIPNPETTGGGA